MPLNVIIRHSVKNDLFIYGTKICFLIEYAASLDEEQVNVAKRKFVCSIFLEY